MGLFWRRKGKDQFVTLGLNEPAVSESPQAEPVKSPAGVEPKPVSFEQPPRVLVEQPELEPVTTGGGPTPAPSQVVSDSKAAEATRSEEHTSELQSLAYLVCRLLLEK